MKHDARPPASEPACVGNAVLLYFKFPLLPLPPSLSRLHDCSKEGNEEEKSLFCGKKVRARARVQGVIWVCLGVG